MQPVGWWGGGLRGRGKEGKTVNLNLPQHKFRVFHLCCIYSFVYSECDADSKEVSAFSLWTTDRGQTNNKDNENTRMLLFSLAS